MDRFIPVKISGKKVIPFEALPFSRFYRNDRNFLYHLFALPVPGFKLRESEKFTGILKMVQLNPVPVFGVKKNTRTIWRKFHRNFRTNGKRSTTLHVHHAFLYIPLPPLHDYDGKMPNFKFYGGRKPTSTKFSFSFWIWIWFLGIRLKKSSLALDKVNELV